MHADWDAYLKKTHNTICGRHPIGVLLGAMGALEEEEREGGPGKGEVGFVHYEQSSKCERLKDSSVSYASGWVRW